MRALKGSTILLLVNLFAFLSKCFHHQTSFEIIKQHDISDFLDKSQSMVDVNMAGSVTFPVERCLFSGGSLADLQFRPDCEESNTAHVGPWRWDEYMQERQQGQLMFGVTKYIGGPGGLVGLEPEDEDIGRINCWLQGSCPLGMVVLPHNLVIPEHSIRTTIKLPSVAEKDEGISFRNERPPNSCCLLSMFCFTSMFDSLLYKLWVEMDIGRYKEFQRVLREELVAKDEKFSFEMVSKDVMKITNQKTILCGFFLGPSDYFNKIQSGVKVSSIDLKSGGLGVLCGY